MSHTRRHLERTIRRASDAAATRSRDEAAEAMRDVAGYIEQHYAEPLTLDRLARVAGWSKRQLSAMFRREVGRTVHEYVTRVRIREAATLIARGVKIEAVSLLVGYRSKKTLYRAFKACMGMPPAEYRKRSHDYPGDV